MYFKLSNSHCTWKRRLITNLILTESQTFIKQWLEIVAQFLPSSLSSGNSMWLNSPKVVEPRVHVPGTSELPSGESQPYYEPSHVPQNHQSPWRTSFSLIPCVLCAFLYLWELCSKLTGYKCQASGLHPQRLEELILGLQTKEQIIGRQLSLLAFHFKLFHLFD